MPHGLRWPIIMDATVPQIDGYRFVYSLPLDERRLLIEDTYYSDTPALDLDRLRGGIEAYAATKGWHIARDVREETGVLPIVLAGDMTRYWPADARAVPRSGLRAALFHPTTGYSLPDAAALADQIALLPLITSQSVATCVRRESLARWDERGFFRLLNRMLFMAGSPQARVNVLARFYRLPEPLIRRFYAAQLTTLDKARIVAGKPPVPLLAALKCFNADNAWDFARANALEPPPVARRTHD